MQAINPAVVKINNTNVNVMSVDTGLYPDVGIADILAYNHIDNPSAQGTTLKAGLAGRVGLLTNGLPAIPVILFGNRYPTVGSLVLYKLTVLTKEQEFTASVTAGATVTATADGLVVQMPATAGDVTLTINNYAFRIVVQDATTVNPYIADHIITGSGIIPNLVMGGFGNAVVISKDGNWLITGIQGFDTDGVTRLNYLLVFNKLQSGNKYIWQLQAMLAPASTETGHGFASWAFDINADGSVIVVGAYDSFRTTSPFTPENPGRFAGDITIYSRTNNTWTTGLRYITPVYRPSFGFSVAISDDGTRIVVGQPDFLDQSLNTNVDTSVFILTYDPATNSISDTVILTPPAEERIGSKFGKGVVITGDGTKVFASNFFLQTPDADPVARIEEYEVTGPSATKIGSFQCDVTGQIDMFNYWYYGDRTISVSDDANTLLIGFDQAEVNGEAQCGLVQVLKRQGNGWVKHTQLYPPSGIQFGTGFGRGVDMTPDAGYLFIGANEGYGNIPAESGSVHVFKYNAQTDTYSAIERIRSENPYPTGMFGWNFSYDRISKYLAISQQLNSQRTINGTIHYIPVGTLIV